MAQYASLITGAVCLNKRHRRGLLNVISACSSEVIFRGWAGAALHLTQLSEAARWPRTRPHRRFWIYNNKIVL